MANANVWSEPLSGVVTSRLKSLAAKHFRTHQLPDDPKAWQARRKELIATLWKRFGTCPPDRSLDPDMKTFGTVPMDGYSIKKIAYQSRPGFYVTGNLYVPDGKGPFPAVVGVHGHWTQGRLAERVQARGHILAKSGYVALLVDAFGSGERCLVHGKFEYHGGHIGASLWDIGESLMGAQIVDNSRAVDLLRSLNFVDGERIGATGASGGGNQTMWLAAMDERVKASLPVVSVGTFESYIHAANCVCETLQDGLVFTEESEILALAAPNAMKICNCLKDTNPAFASAEMIRSFENAKKIWRQTGDGDKFAYQVFNLPHGYWPEVRETMLGWFDLWLKGEGIGAPRREPEFKALPESEVMCFAKGERPAYVYNILAFCRERGMALKAEASRQGTFSDTEKSEALKTLLRVNRERQLAKVHAHGQTSLAGRVWHKVTLETSVCRVYPVLWSPPKNGSGDYVLALGPEGKENALNDAAFAEVLRGDRGVILPDLGGRGEIPERERPPSLSDDHDLARYYLWMGYTMMGEWVKDIWLFADFAKTELRAGRVGLFGKAESGMAALFAAALSERFSDVEAVETPMTYVAGESEAEIARSLGIHIPGFLNWGDMPLVAALCHCPVNVKAPRTLNGTRYNEQELRALREEILTARKKCRLDAFRLDVVA